MSAHAQPRLTPEEYFALDEKSELRHEFHEGVMYAMSGGSPPHAFINTALGRELGNAFKNRPRWVAVGTLRVRAGENFYTYPDTVIVRGEPKYAPENAHTLLNPTALIEVLSPSTEAHDRGFKWAHYRKIESLKEYALVSQSEPLVEIFRRQSSGDWLLSESAGLGAVCRFDSVECAIPLAEIYDKVSFDEPSNMRT
ncbi:MAG: Uma2 family endonuclease [Acidobacteriota bacterium]